MAMSVFLHNTNFFLAKFMSIIVEQFSDSLLYHVHVSL